MEILGGPEKGRVYIKYKIYSIFLSLSAETVECLSLAFQGVDYVEGSDGLSFGVFGVGDSVPDDVFKEYLEDATGLFVNQTRDTFDTTTSGESANGGFGDSLDVITKDLSVPFGTSLSETFSSFAAS